MRPSAVIETVSRSSGGFSVCVATGRLTSMPRLIIGALTMKMISRTSTTSTIGVTLISPSADVAWRERKGLYDEAPALLVPLSPLCPPVCMRLREVTLDQVHEFQGEVVDHRRQHLDAAVVEVEEHRGRDR